MQINGDYVLLGTDSGDVYYLYNLQDETYRNPGNTGDVYCEKGEEITAYKRKRSVFGELKIKIIYRGIKDIDSVL